MKKLAVIGTHGVGKTTLCKSLVKTIDRRRKWVELVDEVVRDCPWPLHEKMVFESVEWIALTQILREREVQLKQPDYIICDRSAYDPIPYYNSFDINDQMPLFDALRNYLEKYLETYDHLIIVSPSDEPIASDGFRNTDVKMQWLVHDAFCDDMAVYMRCRKVSEDIKMAYNQPFKHIDLSMVSSEDIFNDVDRVCEQLLGVGK